MNCVFFGYGLSSNLIYDRLKFEILNLLNKKRKITFYVGNNGGFDAIVQNVLKELSKERNIEYYIVLSRLNENAICGEQEKTIFPQGLENALPRFAICKRNDWLLNNADLVICNYVKYISRASKWIERAKKRGIYIIYIND